MKQRCAVCEGSNDTTSLCAACRVDPANADWLETWEDLGALTDASALLRSDRLTLADLQDRPIREAGETEREVLRLAATPQPLRYRYIDSEGRARGYRQRLHHPTEREIARAVGVSHQRVHRVLRKYLAN